jgi:hypothetical protein
MPDTSSIAVRFARPFDSAASTALPLYAAATGDTVAWAKMERLYGPGAEVPPRNDAARLFHESPDGLLVDVWPCDQPAGLLFDGDDLGHTRRNYDPLVICKRSLAPDRLPNEIAYPAWPYHETLDLNCGPAPVADPPVVTFCGRSNRPPERSAFLDAFAPARRLTVRITHRTIFRGGTAAEFLAELRRSHFVLCPPGQGRYSYRFYETLATGRVPVIPTSGSHEVAPPELLAHAHVVRADGPDALLDAWDALRPQWADVHARNRRAWIDFASPLGWLRCLAAELRSRL